MSLAEVEYVALADWMWKDHGWIVRAIAFANEQDTNDTLVLLPTPQSLGSFTVQDIQKNHEVYPLQGFQYEPVMGKEIRVNFDQLETYLASEFMETVMKGMTIGTFDMATFLYLEPLLKENVQYLGQKAHVEKVVVDQINEQKKKHKKQFG